MSVIESTLKELDEVNKGLNLTDELQTQIHPEVFFRRNSVNLLIGKKGSGKTYNVFREIIDWYIKGSNRVQALKHYFLQVRLENSL